MSVWSCHNPLAIVCLIFIIIMLLQIHRCMMFHLDTKLRNIWNASWLDIILFGCQGELRWSKQNHILRHSFIGVIADRIAFHSLLLVYLLFHNVLADTPSTYRGRFHQCSLPLTIKIQCTLNGLRSPSNMPPRWLRFSFFVPFFGVCFSLLFLLLLFFLLGCRSILFLFGFASNSPYFVEICAILLPNK